MRHVKILATVGPASRESAMLEALIAAGVDGFRVNFSHGTHDEHRDVVTRIRAASAAQKKIVSILGDLSGPKIRCGTFASGPVTLTEAQRFTLTTRTVPGDHHEVWCTYPLARDLHPGDTVLLDDGLLRFRVSEVSGDDVVCVVEVGGVLSDRKGINVPGAKLSVPALTPKDHLDAKLAAELGVDYLALSFVRTPNDLDEARALIGAGVPLIAKIEKPEAVENLVAIIDRCEGIMVARGDLGVELGSEKVPMVQKRAIRLANDRNKLVITATQMLDSMIRSPRPTRAEAADVANAVLDTTDVVMLSGETASGRYPIEAVRMMDSIAREVEGSDLYHASNTRSASNYEWDFANACAAAAALTSRHAPIAGIVVFTYSGKTADLVAEFRPRAPIVAATPSHAVAQRMGLQWGVIPVHTPLPEAPSEALAKAEQIARDVLGAKAGETVAIVLGSQKHSGTKSFVLDTLGR
jgi:pyruvate kinase